jgi:hypothetical protein
MWDLYLASKREGVAIRTTFGDIRRAFRDTKDDIQVGVVRYIDYTKDWFSMRNLFIPITHKRMSFAHESEVRLIWWSMSTCNRAITDDGWDTPGCHDWPCPHPGRRVPVSLPDLIQQVYVVLHFPRHP